MLKIGIITPFSNEFPFLASDFVEGLKMAFCEIKDVNFVHVETERGVANEVSPLFRQLIIKERVNLIVAFLDTTVVQTVKELITNSKTPVIITGMGTRLPAHQSDSSPFIFYNSFRMWESCWLSGKIATNTFGKRVGVFASFFDSGYPLIYAHTKGAETTGGEPQYFNITHKDNSEQEFLNAKTIMAQNEVDYYFTSYYGKERAFMFEWFNREGIETNRIIASPGIDPKEEIIAFITSWHHDVETVDNIEFIKIFKEKTGSEANEFSMLGYESGLFICEALKSNEGVFNSIHFTESLKVVSFVGPRGNVFINERSQSSYSDHFHVFVDHTTGEQKIIGVTYPLEDILMEVESNQPSNLFGWQNTYLCK